MKTLSKLFNNPATYLFILAFSLGCLSHYMITSNGLFASEEQSIPEKIIVKDLFKDDFIRPFKTARQLMLDVSEREDDDFKYLDVKVDGLYKDALKIDINNGSVFIESNVNHTKKENRDNYNSYSSFSTHLNQTFSVPEGVDEKKAEVIKKEGFMTIKFPKVKMMI